MQCPPHKVRLKPALLKYDLLLGLVSIAAADMLQIESLELEDTLCYPARVSDNVMMGSWHTDWFITLRLWNIYLDIERNILEDE